MRGSLMCARWQQRLEIALQMIEAVGGDFGAVFRLGEDKGPLQHRLGEQGGALRAPCGPGRVERLGLFEIRLEAPGVLAYVTVAGLADRGMGVVSLLHHRAEQAGELRQFSLKDRPAELDIAEHPRAGVWQERVGGGVEQRFGARGEMRRRRDGASLLAGEMMKERAL